ncbi:hypothetical protein M7784_10960 [Desulfovibrio aminophilus]|nr:hypothetical protein [Desulfovibrio aminophilus]MCM0755763.1 hypothetical protein [Desulfovibrio aminophilus]
MLRALWWAGFAAAGVWAEALVPGVDFLAPGLVFSLQVEGRARALVLALAWVLLQEGLGSQHFGASVIWYWALYLLVSLGQDYFQPRSLPFMTLLGLVMGLLHFLQTYAMATLSVKGVPLDRVIWESMIQVVVFPSIWFLVDRFYPARLRDDGQPV